MNDIDKNETGARGRLPAAACSACGRIFVPWIKSNSQAVKVCPPCGMMNLALHCEHVEPGDSIAEISDGEQNGAFFRMLAAEVMPNSVMSKPNP